MLLIWRFCRRYWCSDSRHWRLGICRDERRDDGGNAMAMVGGKVHVMVNGEGVKVSS